MFPSRLTNALDALLDVAEAMLAPLPPAGDPPGGADGSDRGPSAGHPHRRPLASTRRRRPSSAAAAQPCVSPAGQRRPSEQRGAAPRERTTH